MSTSDISLDILKKAKEQTDKFFEDQRENTLQEGIKLRNSVAQLREVSASFGAPPASESIPSFKLGDVEAYKGAVERLPVTPGSGHMSPDSEKRFMDHMESAASSRDVASREASTEKAAKEVANEWGRQHGQSSIKDSILHEARAQVVFAAQEVGQKLGLNPVESTVIGYSLERALEKEGFRVMANHAIDKLADKFSPTASSTAVATGVKHNMEKAFGESLHAMAEKGVTREALKDVLNNHAGKFQIVALAAENPDTVKKIAQTIAQSDKLVDGLVKIGKDDELRKAIGNMALSGGEAIGTVNKGVGSAAILAGAALKGESTEDMARHAFRAGMSVLGGAVGGAGGTMATPGFGTVAGAVAGSAVGSRVADAILEKYDSYFNKEVKNHVSQSELQDSKKLIADRMGDSAKSQMDSFKQNMPDKEMGRQMVRDMGRG